MLCERLDPAALIRTEYALRVRVRVLQSVVAVCDVETQHVDDAPDPIRGHFDAADEAYAALLGHPARDRVSCSRIVIRQRRHTDACGCHRVHDGVGGELAVAAVTMQVKVAQHVAGLLRVRG